MNTKQLESFINVAQVLNFSKAAQRMFVSQPTITNQIKSLENELSVVLFQRTKKSVLLTSAGEEFYKDAQEILIRTSMAKARLQDTQKKYRAKVSLGLTVNTLEKQYLPKFLTDFSQQYTNIYLFMQKLDHKSGMQQLIDHRIDAFLFNTKEDIDSKHISIGSVFSGHFCVVANTHNPLSRLSQVKLSDLKEQTLLLPEKVFRQPEFQQLVLFIQLNVPNNRLQYCNDIELAKLMVQSGLGVMIVPMFEIDYHQPEVSIITLILPTKIKQPTYGLAWNRHESRPEVKIFVNQLETHLNTYININH